MVIGQAMSCLLTEVTHIDNVVKPAAHADSRARQRGAIVAKSLRRALALALSAGILLALSGATSSAEAAQPNSWPPTCCV
jgi:hypothetical protein